MSIEEYIRDLTTQANTKYNREIFNENGILRLIDHFSKSKDDLETTKQRIDNMIQQFIEPFETQDIEYNPDKIDTGLQTNSQGTYLSSLMTYALALVNSSNINEINEWISSVPNLYTEELYEVREYSIEELETIKRNLFEKYQDSLTSLEATQEMSKDGILASRYALHKKLKGLNLSQIEETRLADLAIKEGIPALYKEVENICIDKYGEEKGKETYSKIVNYFTMDFENFNSSTYDQIVAFNEEIKSNIARCEDYQLVIGSLNYGNTVSQKQGEDYDYNFGVSTMGQNLADKLGCSCRVRSMINRDTADEMANKGLSKEEVIRILKDSLRSSLQNFNENIKDNKPRTYELFNELIEIKKQDGIYENVWEKHFGITLKEMIEKVVMPNRDLIQELKNKNVDFMYNETLLQESPEKRDKVRETLLKLQERAPGLITVFGDQDHTFCEDYKKSNIKQLEETANFDKEISQIVIGKDKNGEDIHMKVERSETDLYFSAKDLKRFKDLGMSKEEILKYKQSLENKHKEIYKDVPFKRECEWTTISNISGEFTRDGINPKEESYMGKYTTISDMRRKDNSERVNKEIASYNNWKSNSNELGQMSKQEQKQSEPQKIFVKNQPNSNNQGIAGLYDLITIIVITAVVTFIVTIINMAK